MTQYQKAAATRLGISHVEYEARANAGQRWCTGCKRWLMLSDFCRSAGERHGLSKGCRECRARYAANFRERHREALASSRRAYYAANRRKIAMQRSAARWARKDAAKAVT